MLGFHFDPTKFHFFEKNEFVFLSRPICCRINTCLPIFCSSLKMNSTLNAPTRLRVANILINSSKSKPSRSRSFRNSFACLGGRATLITPNDRSWINNANWTQQVHFHPLASAAWNVDECSYSKRDLRAYQAWVCVRRVRDAFVIAVSFDNHLLRWGS